MEFDQVMVLTIDAACSSNFACQFIIFQESGPTNARSSQFGVVCSRLQVGWWMRNGVAAIHLAKPLRFAVDFALGRSASFGHQPTRPKANCRCAVHSKASVAQIQTDPVAICYIRPCCADSPDGR